MPITSRQNALLQDIRKAVKTGRPTSSGAFVAEGPHLVEEALSSCWTVEHIVATHAAQGRFRGLIDKSNGHLVDADDCAFASAASTETTQGILALVRPRPYDWPDLLKSPALLVILDGLQDPGNAGTAVRSAEAFGATGVVLSQGSVRLSNPKLLRATAGSVFRVPVLDAVSASDVLTQLRRAGIPTYGLTASGERSIEEIDWRTPCALVTGSEGNGVSPALLSGAITVRISAARVESLNAGVACSIALYAAQRQRLGL